MTPLPELQGRRVLVLGLGAFGGGAGCARALLRHGAEVTVTDLRGPAQLREALDELDGLPLGYALGGHSEELFQKADWVVVNPAVPNDSPWLEVARRRGCRLTNDLNLALRAAAAVPAFAVTGTHGKSTCVVLAQHLLGGLPGRTVLAGNFGGSILERVHGLTSADRLVLELSSFQTERLEAPAGWPAVAAVTSLSADHLDRHGSLAAYHAAKRRLLAFQDGAGLLFLPPDLPDFGAWRQAARGRLRWLCPGPLPPGAEGYGVAGDQVVERRDGREQALFSLTQAPVAEPYRRGSLLAAVAGARSLGLDPATLAGRLATFQGLPHRMESLPAPPGRRYIDNGVATHPEPTVAALRHLEGVLVLVAGGKDKLLPLDDLVEAARHCRAVHLYGTGGERLYALGRARGLPSALHAGSRAAFAAALDDLRPGETLLFSPSFASYDEYRNFRDRALVFRDFCAATLAGAERSVRDGDGRAY